MEQELEQIEGTVEDIIYENTDNGYTVFEISGGGVLTVVCGVVGELHAGESVVCRGKYENHATYGRQFHAQECETDMPKDLEAVYAFLASGSLPYIGARTATKILDKFGAQALEIIANDPAQLTTISGISADKADRIQQEFKRMFGMRELIAYLAQFEISPRRAMEVFRVFGPSAMNAISSNPYLLCGEPLQLDFRHADSIAQYYHMEGDCTQRLEAALLRTLRHNAGNGHTCLPRAQLLETASNFIHQPPEKLAKALDQCIETDELSVRMFEGTPYIYLPDLLAAEQDIADRLALLAKREKQTVRDLDKNIQVLELTQGFAYAPLQKEAIRKAMTENCLVLTGGPGTGKTTTVNAILQLLEHQAERVALCAPTGRAAKRLSELTGRKASTIHRLLEVDYTGGVVSFIHNDKNLLKCDVVILDEMSMVDVKLFQALIAALRYSCRILMVGDADQLPSVGPGNILGEVIRSERVPTVCLNEIFQLKFREFFLSRFFGNFICSRLFCMYLRKRNLLHTFFCHRDINGIKILCNIPCCFFVICQFALKAVHSSCSTKYICFYLSKLFFHSIELLLVFILKSLGFFFLSLNFCFHSSFFSFYSLSGSIKFCCDGLFFGLHTISHLFQLFFLLSHMFSAF